RRADVVHGAGEPLEGLQRPLHRHRHLRHGQFHQLRRREGGLSVAGSRLPGEKGPGQLHTQRALLRRRASLLTRSGLGAGRSRRSQRAPSPKPRPECIVSASMSKLTGSKKATQFTESVIREMTRLNQLHGGVNLSQGFPDFPAPQAIKDAACAAINADANQYAVTWGARPLREAIAREFTARYGLEIVADEQVTVCWGTTEAMMSTMMAVIDPGDEVVIFEPFYENYGPDAILSGATPRYVTLHAPDPSAPSGSLRAGWSFDPDELAAAFNEKTKAIIINTPNNP